MPTGNATSGDDATASGGQSGAGLSIVAQRIEHRTDRCRAGCDRRSYRHRGRDDPCPGWYGVCRGHGPADGIIARRYKSVSALGKIIDPMADSLYRALVFLGFMSVGWMPVWMEGLIFSRDIIVSYIRIFTQQIGVTYAARTSGKIKAAVQAAAQFGCVIGIGLGVPGLDADLGVTIGEALLLAATLVTVWSGTDYALGAWRLWKARS